MQPHNCRVAVIVLTAPALFPYFNNNNDHSISNHSVHIVLLPSEAVLPPVQATASAIPPVI